MDDKVTEKERYEIIHKMSRRVASVDKYCVVSVSNKAFEEYFGHIVDTLLEVVAPQDKERLINFIDNYDGTAKSGMFKFINARGEERYNHLFVYQQHGAGNEHMRFIGTVMTKSDGGKIVVGRVIPEADNRSYNQISDMIEELQFDSLTHVYNKKTITAYAEKCLKEEKNNRVTIAILDVDHFKKVNDVYGHMYGDKILARVGRKLKEVVGEDGVVGRIGGDEFIIVFNGINDEHALRGMLRAIRTQIKWEFVDDFEDLTITCSIGASYSPNNGTEYEELFKKADYCLYVAKEKGRDRYVFFRDDLHKESYENSLNVKDKNVNDGREMKELRFLSGIMEEFAQDRRKAVDELLHHMYASFKLDSINLYWGHNLSRTYYIGVELGGSMNAGYVNTEEFRKLLGGKNHVAVGFVGRQTDIAPEFGMAMREKRVFSTVQCIVGTQNNVKGIFTIDRCKESSQWAEYEIEMAVVAASLINIIAESENN